MTHHYIRGGWPDYGWPDHDGTIVLPSGEGALLPVPPATLMWLTGEPGRFALESDWTWNARIDPAKPPTDQKRY